MPPDALDLLDNPIWESLTGRHRTLARVNGCAARFEPGHPPFAAVEAPSEAALRDLAALVEPGERVAVRFDGEWPLSAPFRRVGALPLEQRVCDVALEGSDEGLEPLGSGCAEEMLALASATEPGPFALRNVEQGRFLGYRIDGRLVAMAGERFQPPGWTELSAVCTSREARGRGLAERLSRAITAGIQTRGERAFQHVMTASPSYPTSSRLYERLGYRVRKTVTLDLVERVED